MTAKHVKTKHKLQEKFGSVREVSNLTGINYFRLSQALNGWLKLRPDEIDQIKALLGDEWEDGHDLQRRD